MLRSKIKAIALILISGLIFSFMGNHLANGEIILKSTPKYEAEEISFSPVASWPMDEGSGSVIYDQTLNDNDGAITGASWTEGIAGSALGFDGIDDYVEVADSASLNPTDEVTIELWVKFNGAPTWWNRILSKGVWSSDSSQTSYTMVTGKDVASVAFQIYPSDRVAKTLGTPSLDIDRWYHIVGTYKSGLMALYLNGQLVSSRTDATLPLQTVAHPLVIGANSNYGEKFKGTLDEVKIYNRALTAEDVLTLVYKDPKYPVEVRVEDLLSKMTLDEKIGQMTQAERDGVTIDDIRGYFLGSVFSGGGSSPYPNTPEGWADMYDAFQSSALSTRLEIPILYGSDAVHGHNNVYGATIFPHNIGLGATRDPNLIEQIGTIVAKEVAATGVDWTFAPCLAVPRNERWGRTYEGFSEIPEIGELLADRYITGFQGSDMAGGEHIIACTKHWVGDGGTTDGMDQGNTVCSEQELRDIHVAPYIPALNAKVGTVMISYSSWNGDPLHGHKYLITDVLKNELGFEGFVISDWNGIDKIPGDFPTRVKTAVNAGIDMFMQPYNWKSFASNLKSLVENGEVHTSRIDDAVRRILRVKFTFGLFENPYTDRNLTNGGSFSSAAHRAVAREAVRKSLVLLKNENNILPLSPDIGSVFVAGKNADDIGNQCGGWTITWQGLSGDITVGTTILQGIRNVVSPTTTVTFSEDGTGATGHDVAIVVIGELPYAEMFGDSSDLSLDSTDQICLNNVLSADIPVIVILVSGRPMIVTDEIADWDAFVAAWLPGTEGEGVAEVLFGDYNFTGKLPCSWPRSMSQIPINYGDSIYDPLFPYGFGLTY